MTRAQRCWVHMVAKVINALPTSMQPTARRTLAEIRDAEDRAHAVTAIDAFASEFGAKWPEAVANNRRRRRAAVGWPFTTSRPSAGSTSRGRTRSSRGSRPFG